MEIQQHGQPVARVKTQRNPYVQLGALLLVAFVALVATWLLVRGGSDKAAPLPQVGKPAIVSEAQLHELAAASKLPVYWAGKQSGAYELTRAGDGRVWVRYLPSASQLGTRSPKYLTVGTYPAKGAFLSLRRAAARPGGLSLKLDHGGLVVLNTRTPTSVYIGYPRAKYEVEVYDPSATVARTLALSGKVAPIK